MQARPRRDAEAADPASSAVPRGHRLARPRDKRPRASAVERSDGAPMRRIGISTRAAVPAGAREGGGSMSTDDLPVTANNSRE